MFFGKTLNLIDFGFRDVFGVHARHALPFVMHAEHDVRRFCFGSMKELHQYDDDELLRRVVVVVQDDLVATSLAKFAFRLER